MIPWLLAAVAASSLVQHVALTDTGATICVNAHSRGVTAAHVVDRMKREGKFGWSAGLSKGTVRVTWEDPKTDAARVMHASGDALPSPARSAPGALRTGDPVVVVGAASFVLDRPAVVAMRGWYVEKDVRGNLILDVALYPGFSGGCVFDEDGNLRGVAVAVSSDGGLPSLRSLAVAYEVKP